MESWITDERHLPGARQVREIHYQCGYIAARLAAVGTWRHDEEGPGATWWYFLPAIAIAWPYRGKGGWLADKTLDRLLTEIDLDALRRGAAEIHVVARVHHENVPGELLFAAAGFVRFAADDAGQHRAWRRRWGGVQDLELS